MQPMHSNEIPQTNRSSACVCYHEHPQFKRTIRLIVTLFVSCSPIKCLPLQGILSLFNNLWAGVRAAGVPKLGRLGLSLNTEQWTNSNPFKSFISLPNTQWARVGEKETSVKLYFL